MPRSARPLTETQVRNAKPKSKTYKLFDGGGLFLEVPAVGNRRWRFKYRFEDKEKLLAFGLYPDVSLAEARERRDDARKLVRNGQDPSTVRREQKAAGEGVNSLSFRSIAEEWLVKKQGTWTPYHLGNVRSSLDRDVYPAIGEKQVSKIQPTDILSIVRSVENRGALDVAARVIQRCSNILRYAVITGRATSNAAAELRGVRSPTPRLELSARPLSFDGGHPREGGRGRWYPLRLTDEQLDEAINGVGEHMTAALPDRASVVGSMAGALAAEEYIRYLAGRKTNFVNDECSDEFCEILESLFDASEEHLGEQRHAEAVIFIQMLAPYLAFGCRNITEADKKENAKR